MDATILGRTGEFWVVQSSAGEFWVVQGCAE